MQAQDFAQAKWSVGTRAQEATDESVEAAFAAGRILRSHVLRPTWHFVLPADIRWLLTATAPRIKSRDARRYAQLGLDGATLGRAAEAAAAALRGGRALTRGEMAAVLSDAGISVEGQRLSYLLMNAELDAVICSGPRRGKQHTYMLLKERAPDARDLPRDEAQAELARRFFAGHGPATARDLSVWASLTLAEARAAIDRAGLRREERDGFTFWTVQTGDGERVAVDLLSSRKPRVHLVQGYDEYVMGYGETKSVLATPGSSWTAATPPVGRLIVLKDGRVGGFWRRSLQRERVVVEAQLIDDWSDAGRAALAGEAVRFGAFLGLEAVLRIASAPFKRTRG